MIVDIRFVSKEQRFVGSTQQGLVSRCILRGMSAIEISDTDRSGASQHHTAQSAIFTEAARQMYLATATRLLRNREDAEDCVQEAYVMASNHQDQLQDPKLALGWMYRIVLNACRMHRRARKRARRGGGAVHLSLQTQLDLDCSLPVKHTPEQATMIQADLRLVREALAHEAPVDAELLLLHALEDQSLASLSISYTLSQQAVKSRLFRTRRRLLSALYESDQDTQNFVGQDFLVGAA